MGALNQPRVLLLVLRNSRPRVVPAGHRRPGPGRLECDGGSIKNDGDVRILVHLTPGRLWVRDAWDGENRDQRKSTCKTNHEISSSPARRPRECPVIGVSAPWMNLCGVGLYTPRTWHRHSDPINEVQSQSYDWIGRGYSGSDDRARPRSPD